MFEIVFVCPGGIERGFADEAGNVLVTAVGLGI